MLQVEELNQYYGGSHILRGLSFEARIGEVTCLLGRNGVGKTTLLKCLMGLVPARSGSVRWQGETITGKTASAGAGGHRLCAAGAGDFPAPDGGGKSADGAGALFRRRSARRRIRSMTCFRCCGK